MAARFYSFEVDSPTEVDFPEYFLVLGEGMNAFNLTVADLDTLLARFTEEGVVVRRVNLLDGKEAHDGYLSLGEAAPGTYSTESPGLLSAGR